MQRTEVRNMLHIENIYSNLLGITLNEPSTFDVLGGDIDVLVSTTNM